MEKYILEMNMFDEDDKICPLLSTRMIVFNGKFVRCMKEECMWWNKCRHQ